MANVLGLRVLSKGYSLRVTARRLARAEPLLNGLYAAYKDCVKIFEVPDMKIDGAFDGAAKGLRSILSFPVPMDYMKQERMGSSRFYSASPFDFALDTYEQSIVPAEKGSLVLLVSALNAGPQLSSVVITSSVAAVPNPLDEYEYVYTEAEFTFINLEKAIKDRDYGLKSPPAVLYAASKTAAEGAV